MKVGFLGFGEVASTISGWLTDGGVEVYTSLENRSPKTQKLARKYEVKICKDNKKVAEISDILISAVTPAEAVNVAREVGKYVKGVYVDINNISPQTVKKALTYIENCKTVDAAIMGGVRKQIEIIASGSQATQFSILNRYGLNIKVISPDTGKAKALKMLRSYYTKGVSALLFESLYAAYQMGLDEELLKYLEKTEGPKFKKSAISRIKNTAYHAERKAQEMDELINFIQDYENPLMARYTKESFENISQTIELDEKPEDYKEIFESLKDKKSSNQK